MLGCKPARRNITDHGPALLGEILGLLADRRTHAWSTGLLPLEESRGRLLLPGPARLLPRPLRWATCGLSERERPRRQRLPGLEGLLHARHGSLSGRQHLTLEVLRRLVGGESLRAELSLRWRLHTELVSLLRRELALLRPKLHRRLAVRTRRELRRKLLAGRPIRAR